MTIHRVCSASDIELGERKLVEIDGHQIMVFNIDGEYKAYKNWCVHQGGPACEGPLMGTVLPGSDAEVRGGMEDLKGYVLTCPWHGYEYDIRTGETIADIDASLPSYSVTIDEEDILVHI